MTMIGRCSLWLVIQSLKATGLFMPFLFTFHFIEFHQRISTPFVSPKYEHIYGPPIFSWLFRPPHCTASSINTIFSWAPIQIETTIDLLELRNLPWWETLQICRKSRWYPVPLMPWNHMEPHLPILASWVFASTEVYWSGPWNNVKILKPETCP